MTKRLIPNKGSLFYKMMNLIPGTSLWIDCESWAHGQTIQRSMSSRTRYPKLMADWTFTSEAVTGVGSGGAIYNLVRITRLT